VRVPAKVNLQLSVGPPRGDGYHDLVTVFHAVSLFDEVTVRPASRASVRVTGEGSASVPAGHANLAARAARALASVALSRRAKPAVQIDIRKRIPVAAGLAGGSADAAAALVACNELWGTGLSQSELREVAASVGSDVPFALLGGTAIGQGRGELLSPALTTGTYHWVLAFSSGALSTPDVYAAFDRLRTAGPSGSRNAAPPVDPAAKGTRAQAAEAEVGRPTLSTELMAALRSGDAAAVGPLLSNDLQPAAVSLRPGLRRTLEAGRECGALGAIVSGSGPTCAFLAADAARARELAVALTGAGVCRGAVRVKGPAAGAALITAKT
jgi:4-diphosphocytidyl-2-C-methyl-D-erythritol kinase